MDLVEVKSRVAEALVESIFRRARFVVERFHRVEALPLRLGREDYSPNFAVRRHDGNGHEARTLVEVKYRSAIEQFIAVENQRGERSVFRLARRQWPELCFVFVTDRPQPGRSCFQAVCFAEHPLGKPYETVDLTRVEGFGLFEHNIADHEELLRRIFALLAS